MAEIERCMDPTAIYGDMLSFLLTKADILTCLQNCDISARLVFKETKIKVNNYYKSLFHTALSLFSFCGGENREL